MTERLNDWKKFWDVKSTKVVRLFEMAKAAVTGHPPINTAEHGTVRAR